MVICIRFSTDCCPCPHFLPYPITVSQWWQNPGLRTPSCTTSPLTDLIKIIVDIHQSQHQALLELRNEPQQQFKALLQVWTTTSEQVLRSLLDPTITPAAAMVAVATMAHIVLVKIVHWWSRSVHGVHWTCGSSVGLARIMVGCLSISSETAGVPRHEKSHSAKGLQPESISAHTPLVSLAARLSLPCSSEIPVGSRYWQRSVLPKR